MSGCSSDPANESSQRPMSSVLAFGCVRDDDRFGSEHFHDFTYLGRDTDDRSPFDPCSRRNRTFMPKTAGRTDAAHKQQHEWRPVRSRCR